MIHQKLALIICLITKSVINNKLNKEVNLNVIPKKLKRGMKVINKNIKNK